MRGLRRALAAEVLKLKRTLALWLSIAIPASIVGLQFLVMVQRVEGYISRRDDLWMRFGQEMFLFWSVMALPLSIALVTALLGGLEHRHGGWKHLAALPQPRWTVYAAKQVAAMALVGLSILLLVAFTVLAGHLVGVLKPGAAFPSAIPWEHLCRFAGGVYVTSWLLISIHVWLGMRWDNLVVAMGVAIGATIIAMVMGASDLAHVYPWAMPAIVSETFITGRIEWGTVILGGLGGIGMAIWGCRDVIRRDVP